MGHVFRAWDARLHREVAIKLLNHEYAIPGMRERFLREARAASALNHPNICTIFDIGEQDGDPYLVMELLEGETLKDRIREHTMRVDEIISVARDSAEGLGAAHAKGVVHRDVKPANIFLVNKPNGAIQAKILDFGLAKMEGGVLGSRGRSLDITTVGATVGTLAYMSPEQARGEPLDARSDLFSLGVVMYEMATRHVPFQGATSALVFVQLLNHPPEPVREWNDAVPRELEKIIFKLLAKERTARFQSARELELALIAVAEKGSGGGWLRKAVASVPLVRSNDPVARVKRLTRAQASSDPGLQSPPPRPITPFPPANSALQSEEALANGNANDLALRSSSTGDQVLRPVARIPRIDGRLGGNTPVPVNGIPSTFSPVPPSTLQSGGLTPSKRLAQIRLNSAVADAETQAARSATPVPRSGPDPVMAGRPSSGGRRRTSRSPFTSKTVAMSSVEEPLAASIVEEADSGIELDENFPSLFTADSRRTRWNLPLRPLWLVLAGSAILFGLLFLYLHQSRFATAKLSRSDVVVLTEIENHTGDKNLDNSLTEALRFDLAQSPYLVQRPGESYQAASRLLGLATEGSATGGSVLLARKAAERLGARAYIYGTISGNSAPYTLHVELHDVASNNMLATAEAHPESLQQVASSIDQVATELRIAAGEPRSSIDANSIPLASEASSNLAAVQLYADAESLIAARQPLEALADLQRAVGLDPKFIQAHVRLAILYQRLRAETAAADSARLALAASSQASERTRTLVQAVFEREATGDYPHATALLRHLISIYPHDSQALVLVADSLRLQGHMAEALAYAQQACTEDPFSGAAYSQAEMALIGLDRYDAAYQLDLQAQRFGLARPADSLAAADLGGQESVVNDLIADLPVGKIEYRPDWAYGIYLDNAGRLADGAALWRSRAQAAEQNDKLKSAGNFLLSQGGMDRALLGDCTGALDLLPPTDSEPQSAGRVALFNTAVSSALCGDGARAARIATELRERFPQSFEVNAYFLADIQAAEDLHDNQPAAALSDLAPARALDLISITPLLRGRAHVAQNDTAVGIVDFQTELAHRGVIYIVGGDVYPASQIGVARAFAKSGDLSNSAEAYRRFLALWGTADPGNSLVTEAQSHSGS
jgi:serine/threonine protein kinase/tetratricopeptide (TPR) repeat protein